MEIHVHGGERFVQNQITVFGVFHPTTKPHLATAFGQRHPNGTLDEALKVDNEIVSCIAQLADEF
jgi:hypothetical protein